ncbi:MAG TPA: hypothetical protein VGN98_05835, partial [Tianweitania sediminis]|nr:hypothetical protein [Tianweitania sediminis]
MTAILIDKLPDLFAFLAEKLKQKGPFIEGLQGHGVPLALLVRLFATNDTVKVSKKMSSQA